MESLSGVKKDRRRACTPERCSNLVGDDSGLSDACDNDLPAAFRKRFDGFFELQSQLPPYRLQSFNLDIEDVPDLSQDFKLCLRLSGGGWLLHKWLRLSFRQR